MLVVTELVVSGTQCNQWLIQNFPYGDANPWVWDKNLLFGKILAENCMKMKKKLDGVGGRASLVPSSDLPMIFNINFFQGQTPDIESTSTKL